MKINDIVSNPYIHGHCLVRPFCFLTNTVSKAFQGVKQVFEEAHFLCKYRYMISRPDNPRHEMSLFDASKFLIRTNTKQSDRLSLQGMVFSWNHTSSERIEITATAFPTSSPEALTCKAAWQGIAKLVGWVALSIIALPVILPLAFVGLAVKVAALTTGFSPFKRPLTVTPIDPAAYSEIGKIVRVWQRTAIEMRSVNEFTDSANICKLVAQCMELLHACTQVFDRVYSCQDNEGRIQGLLLTLEDGMISATHTGRYLKIAHIVTHPHNMRSPLNESEYTRVVGVGTALIKAAAERAKMQGDAGLYLEGIASSKPFYEKMGFKMLARDDSIIMDGEFAMVLKF